MNSDTFSIGPLQTNVNKATAMAAVRSLAREEPPASLELPTDVFVTRLSEPDEARSVQCECCGMAEDCTPTYITGARERFQGRWVCGMCAEAVGELRRRDSALAVRDAVESHARACSDFNTTVRDNPARSLARSMRDIARSSCRNRSLAFCRQL